MHEAVLEVILLFGLSDGHPKSSVSSCCLSAEPSSLAAGRAELGFWSWLGSGCVPGEFPSPLPLQLAFISIWNIYGTRGMHDSREQGGFMASRQRLVQMCRAATISCQQNHWRYTSQEKVVSN